MDDSRVALLTGVIDEVLARAPDLDTASVMVVGAWCRDFLHGAGGHDFTTSATHDIDLALALSAWETYDQITTAFPRVGDTGIRCMIGGHAVDLLPFGGVESPSCTDHGR